MSNDLMSSDTMKLIANNDINNVTPDTIDNTKNQLRIFLIAQATRELQRVVKLTDMLDKMQDKFEDKVDEFIDNNEDNAEMMVSALPQFMDTIMKCLNRSTDIITKVTGNDKLINALYVDNSNNITNNNISQYVSDIEDPKSRLKIREAVNKIIACVNSSDDGSIDEDMMSKVIDGVSGEIVEDD